MDATLELLLCSGATLRKMKTMDTVQTKPALLIIDIQSGYSPSGEIRGDFKELFDNVNELADFFRSRDLPVIFTFNPQENDPAAIPPEINQDQYDFIITRAQPSVFMDTGLEKTLWDLDINTVVLTGVSIDDNIGKTAINAYEQDIMPVLAGDAIFGMSSDMLQILENDYGIQPVSNERIKELVKGWISK